MNYQLTNLYTNFRYAAPYTYLTHYYIYEYDIEKANISILYSYNAISKEQYDYYYNLPKKEREVSIGLLIRDNPDISSILKSGITEARRLFFESLQLYDENVLYIDNDSITIISTNPHPDQYIQISDIIRFKLKKIYTSYYKLYNIDFLYYNDSYKEDYRLKNTNQDKLIKLHKNHFLDFLLAIAYDGQFSTNKLSTVMTIKNFYLQYTRQLLPIEYYREFNSMSKYRLIDISNYSDYYLDSIDPVCYRYIDISYNASIIRLLYKIYIKEYLNDNSNMMNYLL